MPLHFNKKEYQTREMNLVVQLEKNNIDALLIFRQESMYWLTGYDSFGYVFFQCLVFTKNRDKILLTRAPDLRQAQNTSNIQDIRIWIDQEGVNPASHLKDILKELGFKIAKDASMNLSLLKKIKRKLWKKSL